MKPTEATRIDSAPTLSRAADTPGVPDAELHAASVYTLGGFEIVGKHGVLVFKGKVPRQPLAMLKALIALGPRPVREERIAEILWPHADGDAAAQALATTLHRLRKLIGAAAIHRQEGALRLDPSRLWVDAHALDVG